MARTVVVGVDGTHRSHDALLWAAQAAVSRRDALEIVHAIGLPYSSTGRVHDDVNHGADRLLRDESERALQAAPGLTVRTTLSHSTPGKALTEASEHAALVVVGAHPRDGLERIGHGSLTYQVVAGAHCPALVVPQDAGDGGSGIVVGADGSAESVAAIALAATEADRSGQDLTVVHAWRSPGTYRSVDFVTEPLDERIEQDEGMVLAESLAGLGERYPDLVVHRRLIHGHPAQALAEASKDARLLVVGSRGLGGVARMLLGSVSHSIVTHPGCPVLVVRT